MLGNVLNLALEVSGYNYDYSYSSTSSEGSGAFALVFLCCYAVVGLAVYVYYSYSLMKIAERLGETENKIWAWIPILNSYLSVKMAGKDIMWFALMFIPIANIVAAVVVWMAIAEKLNKPNWLGILMVTPAGIVVPGYLAFSK